MPPETSVYQLPKLNPNGQSSFPSQPVDLLGVLTRFSLTPSYRYGQWLHRLTSGKHRQTFKDAAVLVALIERADGLHVVLTRRAKHLKHHPGQISFPGGRAEATDADLIDTARREMFEEVGIHCRREDVIGCLPSLPTISGFNVTPVIAVISSTDDVNLDRGEVDSMFEYPLAHLLNDDAIKTISIYRNGEYHQCTQFLMLQTLFGGPLR